MGISVTLNFFGRGIHLRIGTYFLAVLGEVHPVSVPDPNIPAA
jgi:hypothetical protein